MTNDNGLASAIVAHLPELWALPFFGFEFHRPEVGTYADGVDCPGGGF